MAQQLTVTLPDELANRVRERVRSGVYSSESAMVEDGLRAIDGDADAEREDWLQTKVAAAYDAYRSDPSRARPLAEVAAELERRRRPDDAA